MAEAHEGVVPFRGFETWYRVTGGAGATPLLALHGGPGASHVALAPLEALGGERPVVLYDQHGSHRSPRPYEPSAFTVETFVEEVGAVRAALGLERVHLLGQSWGGMLALEYLLTRPDGVASVVLSSTLASARLWAEESRRLRTGLPEDVRTTLETHELDGTTADPAYEEASRAFYRRHVCRLDPWPPVVEEVFRTLNHEVYLAMWGPSEMFPTGTLAGWDVSARLGEIAVPALVLCGRYDEATPRQAEAIVAGLGGEAELVVFEESAHMASIEESARYVETVGAFLRRHD